MELERKLDLYARGELTPAEARELAQEALARPDLFEELSAAALAKAAVESNGAQVQTIRPRSKVRIFAIAGSIAAAAAFLTVYLKSPAPKHDGIVATTHRALQPTFDFSTSGTQPILLANQLRPASAGAPIFRGSEPESHTPQHRGSILAIDDQQPTVNLGSLDGLAKGTELHVFRDGKPVGRILVTTIFRDRARGRIFGGETIRVGDEVSTDAALYLSAVLQQVDALAARGDLKRALDLAQKALAQLGKSEKLLARIAALEYQTGAVDAAIQHYEAAAAEDREALNSLAALYLLRGDYERAETRLKQATSDQANPESLNNLGVAAELRGDFQKAAQYYDQALRAPGSASGESQKSVQANLTRVKLLK